MISRLFYLMQCWAWLFLLAFSAASCVKDDMEDVYFLRDDLVMPLMDIASCITGKQKEMDEHGNIIGEKSFEKNFSKAHLLFQDVAQGLRSYPKIIRYPIAQNTLEEINEQLCILERDINDLADGQDKSQFKQEWHALTTYVQALMVTKKDV